jgi:hypothetical protein
MNLTLWLCPIFRVGMGGSNGLQIYNKIAALKNNKEKI